MNEVSPTNSFQFGRRKKIFIYMFFFFFAFFFNYVKAHVDARMGESMGSREFSTTLYGRVA